MVASDGGLDLPDVTRLPAEHEDLLAHLVPVVRADAGARQEISLRDAHRPARVEGNVGGVGGQEPDGSSHRREPDRNARLDGAVVHALEHAWDACK